jgi:protein SCO1/2
MIYFGFAHCPDICPTSLKKMSDVVDTVNKYGIDITPVFITLDPERDTPEILQKYLTNFNSRFIGLTGSEDDIKSAADKFKVYYSLAEGSNKDDYLLDHTSLIYIMDRDGNYSKHFHLDSKPEEIVEYIRMNFR